MALLSKVRRLGSPPPIGTTKRSAAGPAMLPRAKATVDPSGKKQVRSRNFGPVVT